MPRVTKANFQAAHSSHYLKVISRSAKSLPENFLAFPVRDEYFGQEFQGMNLYAMEGHSENFRSLGGIGAEIWPFWCEVTFIFEQVSINT